MRSNSLLKNIAMVVGVIVLICLGFSLLTGVLSVAFFLLTHVVLPIAVIYFIYRKVSDLYNQKRRRY
jgi:type IV secretory pathway VirB2 component (pilin)